MNAPTTLKVCLVYFLCNKVNLLDLSLDKNLNSFGPYDLWWGRYETCKGPKSVNFTTYNTRLFKQGGDYYAWINITFLTQARIDELKINVYVVKNKNTNLLINYKVNNPCQHYALSAIIEKELKAKNCLVDKGDYSTLINFTDVAYKFFGKSFFYGEYILKATVLSKKGNLMCVTFEQVFDKKKNP